MFFIRLCSGVISAYIFTLLMPDPLSFFWAFSSCAEHWYSVCHDDYIWYSEWSPTYKILAFCLWILAWLILEIVSRVRGPNRLLTHFRYGPIAILLLSIATIIVSDMMMIQISRWQIVSYIHSDASPLERPQLKLHDDYRGFCANGFGAHRQAVYGSTPAEYLDDPDPAVRARALHASIFVHDGWNLAEQGPSGDLLRRAANDHDLMVRRVAAEYQAELFGKSTPKQSAIIYK